MFGIYYTYKWSLEEGHIWKSASTIDLKTRNRNLYGPLGAKRSLKATLKSYSKLVPILSTLMIQIVDSLLDALYFIKLKSKSRLIHVSAYTQAIQGALLYACEYKRLNKIVSPLF